MKHSEIARSTIAEVFAAFLKEQEERLAPKSLARYREVIGLLRSSLDNYGYQNLSEPERHLLERFYNAEDQAHSDFCKIFGPDKNPSAPSRVPRLFHGAQGDVRVRAQARSRRGDEEIGALDG